MSVENTLSINVGQTFQYEVIVSEFNIAIGNDEFSVNKYVIEDQSFQPNIPINSTYLGIFENKCNYTLSNQYTSLESHMEFTESMYSLYFTSLADFVNKIVFSTALLYLSHKNFYDSPYAKGIPLELLFFFINATQSTWNFLQSFSMTINQEGFTFNEENNILTTSSYQEIANIAYLRIGRFGSLSINSETMSFSNSYSNSMIYAIDKNTGTLCGVRSFGTLEGKMNGHKIKSDAEIHIDLKGFDLPEISLYSTLTRVSTSPIIIFCCSFLVISSIFRIRRRK